MRRHRAAQTIERLRRSVFSIALLAAPAVVLAQGHEGEAAAHEAGGEGGHEIAPESASCTAASSEEECFVYWEHHINWFSLDYKKAPGQHPEHRHMPPPFGFALINFVAFALILGRFGGTPLREFVRSRHLQVRKDLDEAAALRDAANKKLQEYEARLRSVDSEIDALVKQLQNEAEAEKAQLIAAAQAEAEHIRKSAEAQIQNELARIRQDLRREVVTAAMTAAAALVEQHARPEDQRRLSEEYVHSLETDVSKLTSAGSRS